VFQVSTRIQYGLRALAYLAGKDAPASATEIAQAEGIPGKYLEGILGQLTVAGLLRSERGKNGGYRLSLPPAELPVLRIVEALEGEIRPTECAAGPGVCDHDLSCLPRRFWLGLKTEVDEYLRSRTLLDVIDPAS
jgi:Rrf2 family protein